MAGKDAAYKEQSKSRRDTNQFKRQNKRKQKQERAQSEFMPHGNQYRRKRQQDREESYDEDLDLFDYFEGL